MIRIIKQKIYGLSWEHEFYANTRQVAEDIGVLDEIGLQETIELRFGAIADPDASTKIWLIDLEKFLDENDSQ